MTITFISPTPGVAAGAPGGFPLSWSAARDTPIIVEITATTNELVKLDTKGVASPADRVICRDGVIVGDWATRSVKTAISGGYRLSILPVDGWKADELRSLTLTIDTAGGAAPAWTVDATSGKAVPQNLTEWNALLSSVGISTGGPSHLHFPGALASSTPIPDAIGSKALTVSITPPTYQKTISGWSTKAMGLSSGSSTLLENNTLANVNATPYLVICYAKITGPVVAQRTLFRVGSTFDGDACLELTTTPRIATNNGGTSDRVVGAFDPTGAVRPFVMLVDPVTWTANVIYTDQEKISRKTGATAGTLLTFGGDNTQTWYPANADYLMDAVFVGAAARITKDKIIALLTAMGWSVPLYPWNLTKTGGTNGAYDAGAATVQTWSGDVFVEFKIDYASMAFGVGLSADNPDNDIGTIDFALLNDVGTMFYVENGSYVSAGATAKDDVWRVAREGTAIKYYKNGAVVRTSGLTSSGAIMVDSSFRFMSNTAVSVRVVSGGSTEEAVTWTTSGVTAY